MEKKSVSLTFSEYATYLEVARFGEVEWRRSGCTSATASTICSRRDESRAAAFFFLLVGCRISAKRQQWYGNEVNLWFYQKEGMSAVVVWEGTQNPLVRDRRQIQQRGPWTTASSVFIFCAAAESATEDSRRPEQLWSSVFFVEVSYKAVCWASRKPKRRKSGPAATTNSFFSAFAESVLTGRTGRW